VKFCACTAPSPGRSAEGIQHCATCGERIRDPLDETRDKTIAAIARTVASVDRRLANSNGTTNGAEPESTTSAPPAGPSIEIPAELIERIAARAAEMVAERQAPDAGDGWVRGAEKIAQYIDAKPDRVYALNSAGRIPVEHDGSALIARKSDLDQWIRDGGGRRP
jgi:hypothetical protein